MSDRKSEPYLNSRSIITGSITLAALGLAGYAIKESIVSDSEGEDKSPVMDSIDKFLYRDYSQQEFYFEPLWDSVGVGLAFMFGVTRCANYMLAASMTTFMASFPEMMNGANGHLSGSDFFREVGYNFIGVTTAYTLGRIFSSVGRTKHKTIDDEIDSVISEYEDPNGKTRPWWKNR